jgi:hypothetical protein
MGSVFVSAKGTIDFVQQQVQTDDGFMLTGLVVQQAHQQVHDLFQLLH